MMQVVSFCFSSPVNFPHKTKVVLFEKCIKVNQDKIIILINFQKPPLRSIVIRNKAHKNLYWLVFLLQFQQFNLRILSSTSLLESYYNNQLLNPLKRLYNTLDIKRIYNTINSQTLNPEKGFIALSTINHQDYKLGQLIEKAQQITNHKMLPHNRSNSQN